MSYSSEAFCNAVSDMSSVTEDVKIDIVRRNRMETGKERVHRMKQLTDDHTNDPNQAASSSQSTLEEQNTTHSYRFIDLDLYRAATKDDVDGFIAALERISKDKELPLRAIFKQVSPSGNTLLHIAASVNNRETVRLIADHAPWLLSQKNSKGDTPLHILARAGYEDTGSLVSFLKRSEHSSFGNGHMPDSTEISETLTRLLLKDQNEEGNTCLHEALIHGHEELDSSLFLMVIELEPETPLFCLNNEEKSPLYLATETRSSSCLRLMLERITEFENQSGRLRGKSPVHTAIMKRNTGKSSAAS